MKNLFVLALLCCFVVGVSFAFATTTQDAEKSSSTQKKQADPAKEEGADGAEADSFEPIDNMHHFMEYISQPSYRSLKKAFAGEAPENRRGWKAIKSHALILAETSALVADRVPEGATDEETAQWRQISLDVYTAGKSLYKSVGDFEKSKANYGLMLDSCNKCHQVFDNGKHQLEK